ncbi:MAG: hypothetical protein NZM06_01005 [Chloroherpetonaceae bacterium]|nr:hypothetical protein [Chloroherpetonaceae bacterium]MDW8438402.1 hypothetical protein [Chloroherpetonaceae bacterium]
MRRQALLDAMTRETKWRSPSWRVAFYAAGFGLICSFVLTLFSGSYDGTCYGFVYGLTFGALFSLLSRWIARQIGEGGILWNGFAGFVAGAISGATTKILCSPIAEKVLSAVYGRIESPVQLAFYAVVYAAWLGGFFGLFQSLFFGRSVAQDDLAPEEADASQRSLQAQRPSLPEPETELKSQN